MAARDIMPWKSPLGGTYEVRHSGMTAAESFQVGEPVGITDATGFLLEPPDDGTEFILADIDTVGNRCGIAVNGPGAATSAADPTSQLWIDPRTGNAYATGGLIYYWPADQGTLFITNNVHAAGGASAGVAPTAAEIGEIFQITYGTYGTPDGGWGIEYTAGVPGTDVFATVIDVLDANFNSLVVPLVGAGAGVWVVFEMKTAQ